MHIHILGIAGTFMGSLALIAKGLGHQISGQDEGVYPPMSTQLDEQNINYSNGYLLQDLPKADIYIIGNALSRGNICVEEILHNQWAYTSGAQWLSENVLQNKWVLAVAGTHGKTTTASMLAWILQQAGLNPSFLIGGVADNFGISSRLTDSDFFVIEADEYDSAFFDKRSKFVHYHPKTLLINNLEFDHGDIFDSIKDIQKQFHHLLRIVPDNGLVIYPPDNQNIEQVLAMGVYSAKQMLPAAEISLSEKGTTFTCKDGSVDWNLLGAHNMQNGLGAIYAAAHIGINFATASAALGTFAGVKRRLEVKYQSAYITLYDDFAHHPTAIKTTLAGLRNKIGTEEIIAILELRSNTMKSGVHQQTLAKSLSDADRVLVLRPENQDWDIDAAFAKGNLFASVDAIVTELKQIKQGHFVVMSNGDFGGIFNKIIKQLKG
ncbi:MAG: UDP-N-acetylmuramate:L-alanyl-gamma-D-glutamyl-meso-diaminopimelate ligase [Candidatus Thioglobus sp.]|nr:MAG: UDP-N-acetylmuramate:L-alanyl-gamma-D-glutamyl-meso-diaminopimelate ligase [Candidatus Thioglobus sp.]KAA0456926.1 MAG: UDP-N-acetylmuramate:L-alanyl-gamma-D-glutamyl-meso-diaminopimelate ligase [Candidatus Thioglobus sp.]